MERRLGLETEPAARYGRSATLPLYQRPWHFGSEIPERNDGERGSIYWHSDAASQESYPLYPHQTIHPCQPGSRIRQTAGRTAEPGTRKYPPLLAASWPQYLVVPAWLGSWRLVVAHGPLEPDARGHRKSAVSDMSDMSMTAMP